MSILKLKAKVMLTSEEQMEADETYDLGNIAKSKEWVWRNIGVKVEEVYRIIEYNKTKTIVQMYDEEKILVSETFDEVFEKWEKLKILSDIEEADPSYTPEEEEEDNDEEK